MAQFDRKKVALKFLDWLESTGRTVNSRNIDRTHTSRVVSGYGNVSLEDFGRELSKAFGLDGIAMVTGSEQRELERLVEKEKNGTL